MDLSRMSKESEKFLKRYTCGLDEAVMERRKENAERILKYFGRSGDDWNDWKWHTRNIIRSAETLKDLVELSAEDFKAVRKANEHRIPFGITPYYLSLMDLRRGGGKDDAVRAQVIPPMDYVEKMVAAKGQRECSMDFMMEKDTSPLEGVTRRYPGIVILKPILTCPQICVYCQRNWEIEDVFTSTTAVSQKTIDRAVDWIGERPEISEVLITGGDPLLLSNDRLFGLLEKLSGLPGVERVRIGTRMPVTLPQRVTDDLVQALATFHRPGKRELILVTHFEHSYEITPESLAAVQKFRRCGMDVYNQLVYTFYNSRRFEAVALRQKLRLIGVTPYYTFNTKGKEETQRYRVPIARLLQEQHEEARLMPGTVRTDEIVFNVPRLGKNYLRASQHHDVISILPTGQRVFEFHPWEKKLSLVDTYVYTDVSIHDYLQRLKTVGEKRSDYQTIWYYY
jgi:lysine 2,3-aminomutase